MKGTGALKLENLIEGILPYHTETLRPIVKRTRVSFHSYSSGQNRAQFMSDFYVNLSCSLYGGRRFDKRADMLSSEGEILTSSVKPDGIDEKNKIIWESKAAVKCGSCELTRTQLEGYFNLQYNKPEYQTRFYFFRHSLEGIKARKRTEKEVMLGLLHRTAFSLNLPLSVVLRLDQTPASKGIKLTRQYVNNGSSWPSCLCLNSSVINRFLKNPQEQMDLLDFDLARFKIERYLCPRGMEVNKRRLSPFPIIKINDLRYGEWIENEFMPWYENHMERNGDNTFDTSTFD